MKLKALVAVTLVLSFNLNAQHLCAQTRRAASTRTARAPRQQPAAAPRAHAAGAPEGSAQEGQTLPIRRVILYSNGVAYVERRGAVTGHAEIALSFKQSQVDDVLKSMVVLDLGEGRIGAVSYNSSAPPQARLNDIPFTVDAQTEGGGLAQILTQLQGARVVVTTKAGAVATGSVLTVERRNSPSPAPDKPPAQTHALVVASETGELMSFELSDVRSVRLADEGARRDIKEFATASASARRRDAKTIVVTSDGAGSREMIVSYTIAAPIWKTTYRVVLDSTGKPFFQGWAIVDNVSEEDWIDVRLSLISGTPISFIQPLQQPFYRYRPVVPRPADLRLEPQVHDPSEGEETTGAGGVGSGGYGAGVGGSRAESNNVVVDGLDKDESAARRDASSRIQQRQLLDLPANNVSNLLLKPGLAAAPAATSLSDAIAGGNSGVEAAAEGAEVGDLFEYQIAHPVTVLRDRSALIPIVQTRMEGARVSIFNEAARRDRPLSGMLLKNTSGLTLEDGALTVIDGNAYAGEALMERLKPEEQRLVSFALDLGTLAGVRQLESKAPAFIARIRDGVFQVHYFQEDKKVYALTNQTDKPRVVYVEHPVRQGWELAKDAPKPEGRSARYYRFRVELAPHAKVELPVAERRALMDAYALSDFTRPQLDLFVARRYVDEPTRAALQSLIDLKTRVAALEARDAAIDEEIEAIGEDQKRLRENIEALTKTAEARQLITRYIAKADAQETRIEVLTKEKQTVAAERERLQAQLDAAIRAMVVERNLAE
ncbi:MAG TPA: hypothetical protein VM864_00170 [Pyrinomonadaceae bacterium]|jgi:hypothetical protein|nr:hypothetical protein [Pyrinomonadaceae bacterium]